MDSSRNWSSTGRQPIRIVTGVRQCGKSSLLERLGSDHTFVSLDDLQNRQLAQSDPALFLQTHPGPAILDEIQHAPQLFSEQKRLVDAQKAGKISPRNFWLSGSNLILLRKGVEESLARRASPVRHHRVDGRFELKVPSGALRLGLDLSKLPGGAFVVETPAFKLAPGQVRDLTMLVSLKGRIQVQLSQNGQPLTLSGVPIEIEGIPFRYSNRMGRAEFPEVPPGAYRVSISPESLPKGVRLGVHANQTVNLQPGQTLEINLELEKK